jgi:phenylalanine-4-hydroxylase
MGTQSYDITHYQPILFAADGIEHLLDVVGGFFAECDDDSPARLASAASVHS